MVKTQTGLENIKSCDNIETYRGLGLDSSPRHHLIKGGYHNPPFLLLFRRKYCIF